MINEVSMMNYKLLDLLDRFLTVLMENDEYMGGKLVVLMHDFRQILPIVPHGNRADIVAAAVTSSELWNQFTPLLLQQNMRVQRFLQTNPSPEKARRLQEYSDWLLNLGDSKLPSVVPNIPGIIQVPDLMVCKSQRELVDKVCNNFILNYQVPEYLRSRAIMSSTNDIKQQQNFEMVESSAQALIHAWGKRCYTA
jgi:hypothetical protein